MTGKPGGQKTMNSKRLNRDVIKYIAMATMLCNHIANIFMEPGTLFFDFMIGIGYFTAPVMCYFLAEGYHYTHSKTKYAMRLAVFAVLSEIPFCMAFAEVFGSGGVITFCGFNMIFTLLLCFYILLIQEYVQDAAVRVLLIFLIFCVSVFSDWAIMAPAFTLFFSSARCDSRKIKKSFLYCIVLFLLLNLPVGEIFSARVLISQIFYVSGVILAGIIIVYFYNGKRMERGRTFSKWFFYLFYPIHLLILGLIRIFI